MKNRSLSSLAFALGLSIFVCGCSQPLRTLMAVGAEQKQQQAYVTKSNKKYQRLLQDVRAGDVVRGMARQEIVAQYGQPVLIKEPRSQEAAETFLYRHPTEFFGNPKVYMDFDASGTLLRAWLEEP